MSSVVQIIQRRHRRNARRARKDANRRVWGWAALALLFVGGVLPVLVAVSGAALMYWRVVQDLPSPQASLESGPIEGATQLYDRSGQVLLTALQDPAEADRQWLALSDVPDYLVQATLLMEDPNFLTATPSPFTQTGLRLWQNVFSGPLPADTTLTGRLVRNVITGTSHGQSATAITREREIAFVAEINRVYSPEEILTWHLNTNYYGNDAYGIEAAAQTYLGKPARDLTLDEAALLAAIPPAPQYNPIDNETAARGRQDDVLRLLLQNGHINTTEYDLGVTTLTPILNTGNLSPEAAPEFAAYARRQASAILTSLGHDGAALVARGGLQITTTLDLDLYYQSQCALQTHLQRLNNDPEPVTTLTGQPCQSSAYVPNVALSTTQPPTEGALVVLDVTNGQILSMVGTVSAQVYQPGPVLHPFVYFDWFLSGRTPADMLLDIPRPFPGAVDGLIYTPANPDGQFRGPLNLRDAMVAGLLPPAVEIANRQRIDNILSKAHLLGLNSLTDNTRYDLSLLERGGTVSLMDISYAYSVLSSMGEMRGISTTPLSRGYRGRDPVAVLKIEDAQGNLLWEYETPNCGAQSNCTLVYQQELGYLINHVLSDHETRQRILGQAATVLNAGRPAAVVNGLTGDDRDAWTVGYTPQVVIGVHLGRADQSPMQLDDFGFTGAAPVWRGVLDYLALRDALPATQWPRPETIVEAAVCERSGLLPNGYCPTRREVFYSQYQPNQVDTYWQEIAINNQTYQRATVNTPPGLRTEQVYFVPPQEAMDWWVANNQPLPPQELDSVSRPELLGTATIIQPAPFAYVGGIVDIRGSMDPSDLQFYQLAYGEGVNPEQWIQIGEQQYDYVRGATLGTWDTTRLDGLYNLRLTVVLNDNSIESDIRQVFVDNTPPVVELSVDKPDGVYQLPQDRQIVLTADVTDNYGTIDRVDFYRNDELIGTDREAPFGFSWEISQTGQEQFTAVAFDAIGNQASTQITVQVTRD